VTFSALRRPDGQDELTEVVGRVRNTALTLWRSQLAVVFGLNPRTRLADQAARFALAAVDGAFIATQADPAVRLATLLTPLPGALAGFVEAARAEPPARSRRAAKVS
jgi:hypothetical protein